MDHVRRVIDDTRIEMTVGGRFTAEPSPVSRSGTEGFRTISRALRSVVPQAIVAPYLVVVVTDARHYSELTENAFRFLPLRLTSQDLERMHGLDERVAIRDYYTAIRIYRQLLVDAAAIDARP